MSGYGIVVDVKRCTGFMTCVLACKAENDTAPGVWWNKVLEIEDRDKERIVYFRCACMHCENPPCVEACPSGALTFGDPDDPDGPAGEKFGQAAALLAAEKTRPRVSYIRPQSLARLLDDRIREDPEMKTAQSC